MKANLPSRTLWPMVADAGATLAALSTCDSRVLVVKSKIPGSLPPVLIMMIRKTSRTANGRLKRFFLNQGRCALWYALFAAASAAASRSEDHTAELQSL